jgi:hypothetical protein
VSKRMFPSGWEMRKTWTGMGSAQDRSVRTRRRRSQIGRSAGCWSIEGRHWILPVWIMLIDIGMADGVEDYLMEGLGVRSSSSSAWGESRFSWQAPFPFGINGVLN